MMKKFIVIFVMLLVSLVPVLMHEPNVNQAQVSETTQLSLLERLSERDFHYYGSETSYDNEDHSYT